MHSQRTLLMATAFFELGAGFLLAALPALAISLFTGARDPSPEALIVSRMGGAALLAIAIACWLGRDDRGSSTQHGLLWGVLVYNVGAFSVLVFAGGVWRMSGVLLWPGVALHAAMTIWCVLSLRVWRPAAGR